MTAPALDLEHLRGLSEATLDDALRSFADAHGAQALPALVVGSSVFVHPRLRNRMKRGIAIA